MIPHVWPREATASPSSKQLKHAVFLRRFALAAAASHEERGSFLTCSTPRAWRSRAALCYSLWPMFLSIPTRNPSCS